MILQTYNSLPYNAGCYLGGTAVFPLVLPLPSGLEAVPEPYDGFGGDGYSVADDADEFGAPGQAVAVALDEFGGGGYSVLERSGN